MTGAQEAEQASDLLVTAAETLNERLAVTAHELARSQALLREASAQLMIAFRGAADRIVAAQRTVAVQPAEIVVMSVAHSSSNYQASRLHHKHVAEL